MCSPVRLRVCSRGRGGFEDRSGPLVARMRSQSGQPRASSCGERRPAPSAPLGGCNAGAGALGGGHSQVKLCLNIPLTERLLKQPSH